MAKEINLNIPRKLFLDDYEYTYKDELVNDYYTYRCTHKYDCKVVLKIHLDELINYNKNNKKEIKYIITSSKKIHTCKSIKNDNNKNDEEEFVLANNIKKNKDLIYAIILKNLNKPLSFHMDNLKNNNVILTTNQIKWILQKLREKEYVSDEIFLKDISKINISLDDNIPDMINIPICYK